MHPTRPRPSIHRWCVAAALLAVGASAARSPAPATQDVAEIPDYLLVREPKAQILLLGTFHFSYPGLDAHQIRDEDKVDMLSERRQEELIEVVELLETFEPTKVAVERMPARQDWLDRQYEACRAGEQDFTVNEVQQIGFRLAIRLGHPRVYAVDADGRSYAFVGEESVESRLARYGARETDQEWDSRFEALYRHFDRLALELDLRRTLLAMNDPERIRQGHGHYLIGRFKAGAGDDYLGVDLVTAWYNRNLRMFHNLQRITESESERILVVVGAGHLPLLRHCVQTSPEYDLVEVGDYLAD